MQFENSKHKAAPFEECIQNARYKLTTAEQKLILHLSSLHTKKNTDTHQVPLSDLEQIFQSELAFDSTSFHEFLSNLISGILEKKIVYPSGISINSVEMRGHINWIAGAIPKYDEAGELQIEFAISPQLKSYFSQLNKELSQNRKIEVARMSSGFSILLFQWCEDHLNHYGEKVLSISLPDLKNRLNVADKYPDIRNFRRKVLEVAKKEINQKTRLDISYSFGKQGRTITTVNIHIVEKRDLPENHEVQKPLPGARKNPANLNIRPGIENIQTEQLPEALRRAYISLTEYGIQPAMVLEEVFPMIRGSELRGYEDFFVQFMIAFFETKTKARSERDKAIALQKWISGKRFENPSLFAQLMEEVVRRKKQLRAQERENRERAKTIPAMEFRKMVASEKVSGQFQKPNPGRKIKPAKPIVSKVSEKEKPEKPEVQKRAPFNYEIFKTENAVEYNQIRKDRKAAFAHLKSSPNYKQLLENSIQAYCEQWYKNNG